MRGGWCSRGDCDVGWDGGEGDAADVVGLGHGMERRGGAAGEVDGGERWSNAYGGVSMIVMRGQIQRASKPHVHAVAAAERPN
jgi:hypothetical protein